MAKINDEYDIGKAFEAIENELIASYIRNLERHKVEEVKEDKQWTMWQTEQLKALEKYKKDNQKKYSNQFEGINAQIKEMIRTAKIEGGMEQEIQILNAIKKGFPARKVSAGAAAEFFKLNERKLEALIKATVDDMEKAETAVLRMANDQYRKVIYNAQVYANTGAGTYEKAVDMATKDFLAAGLNCVEYANGARHTISDYADMAIRTASKRAYLQGEGEKRQEWGIATVIMNKRGNPCPKCLPFAGKVLIDDVWSGGKASDGPYSLMSEAIAAGLYHPRCKDSHTTYFEGISTPPDDRYTRADIKKIEDDYREEQKKQYAERQEKKYGRLAEYSLDEDNQKNYQKKEKNWGGLAATKDDIASIPEHEPPVELGLIDVFNRNELRSMFERYEKEYCELDIETACVVTKSGKVYLCYGTKDRVFPDYDLRDELIEAYVSHTHPMEVTEFSFSDDDFELFQEYKLTSLRGCDTVYTYELSKEYDEVDEVEDSLFNMTEENYQHFKIAQKAKGVKVGYGRWKMEK